jgi:hypothetical protein
LRERQSSDCIRLAETTLEGRCAAVTICTLFGDSKIRIIQHP